MKKNTMSRRFDAIKRKSEEYRRLVGDSWFLGPPSDALRVGDGVPFHRNGELPQCGLFQGPDGRFYFVRNFLVQEDDGSPKPPPPPPPGASKGRWVGPICTWHHVRFVHWVYYVWVSEVVEE